jgi:predicted ATPase/DNA-binding CsgD family transcriptional regulator
LLERDEPLAALSQALALTRECGRLVSLSGEAGIGKSSLLRAFAQAERNSVRFLWGGCDALQTPSPLGPLVDIAADLGGDTAQRLRAAVPRHDLFAAFVGDLAKLEGPTAVIFEDVHWADEATLDLLKYAGRRIDRTHALLVVTWRDDEVDLDHAIHRVLGEWRHSLTLRLQLKPLSIDAVRRLAGGSRDAVALHTVTCGNPFFVTEVLGTDCESVPASVRDAVLARRAGLSADARAVLDFVSIVPSRAELPLLEAALETPAAAIERCIAAGLLRSESNAVMFRHELARMAVASALPVPRALNYHRRVFETLLSHFDSNAMLARVVHHAAACGAVDAIVQYAPAAARQAAALGAHRQALEHYRRALEHRDRLSNEAKAQLIESCAYEYYVTGQEQAARDTQREALELWQRLDVTLAIGRNVRWLSRVSWFAGDRDAAEAYANEAIAVLQKLPETTELAMAYSNRAQLDMLKDDLDSCVAWASRAIELAQRLDAPDVLSHALNNLGTARANAGDAAGSAQLEQSLELALSRDLHEHAARAYTNLGSGAVKSQDYAAARHWLQRGIAYSSERDLDAWTQYMLAWRARLHAETGAWASACSDAAAVISAPRVAVVSRIPALAALGLVHARRGDSDAQDILDEALILARPTREPQRLIPILSAHAELAWLSGRTAGLDDFVREALESVTLEGSSVESERLRYCLRKLGVDDASLIDDGPYGRLLRGEWESAAAYWSAKGCPYEQGEALLEGDVAAVKRGLELFQTLGAVPAAARAQQRLRQLGAQRIPRGRRSSTRAHPAGLTSRESDILGLIARGFNNPDIAAKLFVSRKTVEHHVSSILGKLDVPSREEAAIRAREEGWLG